MDERYAREVIAGFPYPIASPFIRLRTDECLDPGPLRLKYLLATAEAISRFLGVVTLCQCRDLLEAGAPRPGEGMTADFARSFRRPSWGIWLQLTREGLKWQQGQGAALAVRELPGVWFGAAPRETETARALGELLTIRNGLNHEKIKVMHAHEFRELCARTWPLLERALEGLSFLLEYELKFVSGIEVEKRRRQAAAYRHRFKMITGSSDDFHGERRTLSVASESTAVILARTGVDVALNLDPLLVYEESAFWEKVEGAQRVKIPVAPDIFFYNGMDKPEKAEYSPCKQRHGFWSSTSARAEEIAEELGNLLTLFGAGPGAAGDG